MRVGSLFSGYGGLDLAVGGDLAWYSEIEPAACKVLAAHHPGVPNLGDITQVNWSDVPPVDVITGGYPCQPFSTAGARKGTDDERHLWPYVRDALSAIRPRYAVLENVRGHLTLGFDVVLSDLAHMGWSARWGLVRASDAGAPHHRARLFIVANPEGNNGYERPRGHNPQHVEEARGDEIPAGRNNRHVANPEGGERGPAQPDHLPQGRPTEPRERPTWGGYAPAIHRWETIIGRPSPAPTIQRAERERLNPAFVEWMMGLDEGWVTGHDLTHAEELKMLGNGVVPQQARLALDLLAAA